MNQEHKEPSFIDEYEDSPLAESTSQLDLENDMSDPNDISLSSLLQIRFSLNRATLSLLPHAGVGHDYATLFRDRVTPKTVSTLPALV